MSNRQTKIVATLGPASTDIAVIRQLAQAGVNVFRLNFSHADTEGQRERYENVRKVEAELGRPIGIFADMQGPKLRVGRFKDGSARIAVGQRFTFDQSEAPGDSTRVQLPHPEIYAAAAPGQTLLVDDGKIRLQIEAVTADTITTTVLAGSVIKDRKGVNVPGAVLPISALTPKDRVDLEGAIGLGVDWIALSFVQRPEDLEEARRLIAGRAGLIAKIEKPAAVDCLKELIELSDAVMVARGDLGVEMPMEEVPGIQKRIVQQSRDRGRPVIVATQMLESMIESAAPTRAEISDVATAVFDGADAVMLSAETAAGAFPVEAVSVMARVAATIEQDSLYATLMEAQRSMHGRGFRNGAADAIGAAAREIAVTSCASCIVSFTSSGGAALQVARERPAVPILALTPGEDVARKLTLPFGVRPVIAPGIIGFLDMTSSANIMSKKTGLAQPGDCIVITAGVPFGEVGSTNILHVAKVD